MEKLQQLINRCKADINLDINNHKSSYQTVKEYFGNFLKQQDLEDIDKDIFDKMVELDIIIELQFYPDTPIGSYCLYHYDLDKILDEALNILK